MNKLETEIIMNKNKESGFVLLVAIGILMGSLSIVAALVSYNQRNDHQAQEFDQNATADSLHKSFKNIAIDNGSKIQSSDKTRIFKNWHLPGSKNLPIKLTLSSSFSNSSDHIYVHDMRKIFFQLATNKNKFGESIKLKSSIDSTDTTFELYTQAQNLSTNPFSELNTDFYPYIVINNELMVLDTNNGSSRYSVLSRGGYGGVSSRHEAESPVFVLDTLDYSEPLVGYLKIAQLWYEVEIVNMYSSSTNKPYFQLLNGTDSQLSGGNPATTVDADTSIEFYPFDPSVYRLGYDWNVNFSFQVKDENSKFNLNTLSKPIAESLFTSDASYLSGVSSFFPFRFNKEYLSINTSTDTLDLFNKVKNNITVYNKPNFFSVEEAFITEGTLTGVDMSPLLDDSFSRMGWTDITDVVMPHSINVNTASANVLMILYDKISSGITSAEAERMSVATILYRSAFEMNGLSGTNYNFEFLEDNYDFIEEYNKSLNPFDGTDDYVGEDTIQTSSAILSYGSPEEEYFVFLDILKSLSIIDTTQINDIMAHVRKDIVALDGKDIVNFITFDESDVETQNFNFSISIAGEPILDSTETIIVENHDIRNAFGEDLSSSASNDHTIYLNSSRGWNLNQSTLYGVTSYQPSIKNSTFNATSVAGNIIFNEFDSGTSDLYSDIYPSLIAKTSSSNVYIYLDSFSSYVNNNTISMTAVRTNVSPDIGEDTSIDLGMRVKGKGTYLYRDLTAASNLSSSGCILISSTDITAGDLNVWSNYITNNTGVMVQYTKSGIQYSYKVDSIDTTTPSYEIRLDGNALPTPALGVPNPFTNAGTGDNIIFSAATDNSFYRHSGDGLASTGSSAGANQAFYETVIDLDNVEFKEISWDDTESVFDSNDSCIKVEVFRLSNAVTPVASSSAGSNASMTFSINEPIRIRFTFDGTLNPSPLTSTSINWNYPSPQLFEVRIKYEPQNSEPKARTVYSRE